MTDPQWVSRQMSIEDPRDWKHVGVPMKFQEEPGRVNFDIPGLGAHSEEVLSELGFPESKRVITIGFFPKKTVSSSLAEGSQRSGKMQSMPWAMPLHCVEPS